MATGSALTKLVQLTRKNKSNDIGFYLTELMNSSMDKKDEGYESSRESYSTGW